MFNGIVETTGVIHELVRMDGCLELNIKPAMAFTDIKIGDSIDINGVCLTVTTMHDDCFTVTVVPQTQRITNFDTISAGDTVNLERSLKVSDRINGHYVQGHVDAAGEIIEMQRDGGQAYLLRIKVPTELIKYIVSKGYIAIDGMSITVIAVDSDSFTITLIPHTCAVTRAKYYAVGSKVNIEIDIFGKYIEKLATRD